MAVLINRVLQLKAGDEMVPTAGADLAQFADYAEIPSWAKESIAIAAHYGIVKGRGEGRFALHDHATRAEAVVMLLRLFDILKR